MLTFQVSLGVGALNELRSHPSARVGVLRLRIALAAAGDEVHDVAEVHLRALPLYKVLYALLQLLVGDIYLNQVCVGRVVRRTRR